MVGEDISRAVLNILNGNESMLEINHTYIILIPKMKAPQELSNFRPISLCNVIYKLVSKVMPNRLKVILPRIISDSQCAFVKNRFIIDNVLIAYELIHTLKNKRVGEGRIFSNEARYEQSI